MPLGGAQTTPLVTQILGLQITVVVQDLESGPTCAPVQRLVPVTVAVSVMLPKTGQDKVLVAVRGAMPPTSTLPMEMVISSAGLPGVPLSSTTTTPISGTLPQLVTIPLTT